MIEPRVKPLVTLRYLLSEGSLAGETDSQLLDRFLIRRDEQAFAALVSRHGPMVLGLCRSVLRNEHDAEDAFQATFIVLARKAGSIWERNSLGGWLHRVALRLAIEANRGNARRAERERGVARIEVTDPDDLEEWHDRLAMLHEEIDRLPEKFRVPVVLCELQSLTRDQAAERLGWPSGTVAGRLARARRLLRDRLLRRGLAGVSVFSLTSEAVHAAAVLPRCRIEVLVAEVTASLVSRIGATSSAELMAEAITAALARSGLRKLAMVVMASAGLAATAVLLSAASAKATVRQVLSKSTVSTATNGPGGQLPSRKDASPTSVPVAGKVLDSDGRATAGVRVFYSVRNEGSTWGKVVAQAVVDERGNFHLDLPRANGDQPEVKQGTLWAYRTGSLLAAMPVSPGTLPTGLPARLVVGPPALRVSKSVTRMDSRSRER